MGEPQEKNTEMVPSTGQRQGAEPTGFIGGVIGTAKSVSSTVSSNVTYLVAHPRTIITKISTELIYAKNAALKLLERSEEHTSELQSPCNLVCRLLLEKKKKITENADVYSPHTASAVQC